MANARGVRVKASTMLHADGCARTVGVGAPFIFGYNLLRHLLCFKVFYYSLNPLF
jgi:hypothetical protein